MVRRLTKAILLALALFVAPKVATAGGSASVDVLSNYVWRGQNLVNDGIVIQPTVGVEKDGFAMEYWANYSTDSGENTETDLTVSYSTTKGKISYEIGYINYDLLGAPDTQEIYLSIALDAFLSPYFTIYYDFDEGDGAFAIVGVDSSKEIGGYTLNCGASVGINIEDEIMGYDKDGNTFTGLYYAEVTLSLDMPVGGFTVSPQIAYSAALGDGEDAIKAINIASGTGSSTDTFYGGIGVSAEF